MKKIRVSSWLLILFLLSMVVSGCSGSGGPVSEESAVHAAEPDSMTSGAALTGEADHETKSDIISWFTADINADGQEELLMITTDDSAAVLTLETGERYGSYIDIWREFEMSNEIPVPVGEPDHRFDLSDIKPFRIQAGDINGDGVAEIAVSVYKTAEFHPVPAKRPFFYDLADGELEPVWLGSRLSRPYADYILFDMDDDDIEEIVSIEYTESGNQVLAVYDWKGFGFEVKAVSEEMEEGVIFLNHKNSRADEVYVEIARETHQLRLEEGEIIRCIKDY